jgi:hypothetical protein
LIAAIDWLGSSSRADRLLVTTQETSYMLNPQKTLEREALLKRIRELDAEIAQSHLQRHLIPSPPVVL